MNAIKEAIDACEQEVQENAAARRSLLEHVAAEQNHSAVTEAAAAEYLTTMTFDAPALSSAQLFEQAMLLASE